MVAALRARASPHCPTRASGSSRTGRLSGPSEVCPIWPALLPGLMGGCPISNGKTMSIAKKRAGKEKIGASARRIEGMTQTCIPRRRYTRQPSVRDQRNFGRLLIVLFALWAVVTIVAAVIVLG